MNRIDRKLPSPASARLAAKLWLSADRPLAHRLLAFTILNGFVLNLVLLVLSLVFLKMRMLPRGVLSNSLTVTGLYFFRGIQGTDSWGPMLEALRAHAARQPIYDTVFFLHHTKFQYPLTSLLPLYALQRLGLDEPSVIHLLNWLSWAAVWATIAFCAAIVVRATRNQLLFPSGQSTHTGLLVLTAVLSGLLFFPLMWAYDLGQIQIFLSLLFSAAFYCWISGREVPAGVLTGLMILIKPQYALFAVWFLLRRRVRSLLACAAVVCAGFLLAVQLFGWHDHIRYLDVLAFMGKRGETFYYNLSVNGLMNRLLLNGNSLEYTIHSFPPYHPVVYAVTTITSFFLICFSLFFRLNSRSRGAGEDFGIAAISMTLASPIAWDHHYGVVLPVFAFLAGRLDRLKHVGLLAASYVLLSNAWSPANIVARIPGLNILQSLPLFGVVLLLLMLYRNAGNNRPKLPDNANLKSGEFNLAISSNA
ncbi:MAG: glycosyltransferase family 87 protein [Bryobacteraceae bacterium]